MSAALSVAPYTLRPGAKSDHNLVFESWKLSHRHTSFGGRLSGKSYNDGQNWLVEQLLERCALMVAGYDADPEFILGWCVTSTGAVHYCWVRPEFRRLGIAKALLFPYLDKPTTYTHPIAKEKINGWWNDDSRRIIANKIPESWEYNPFHAFRIAAYPRANKT